MKHSSHFLEIPMQRVRQTAGSRAFTLAELVVVIGIFAILSAMLLPAMCKAKSQNRVTACAANFRQWALSANMYAKDNQEWLPTFKAEGGGGGAWDVSPNMCNALAPYGMDVPKWLCPMNPNEWDNALIVLGHPIQSIDDLNHYFSRFAPGILILNNNYWVPRPSPQIPTDYSKIPSESWPDFIKAGQPESAVYGWPRKLHDTAAAHVPFVSDSAASGPVSPDVQRINPNTAHFINGTLLGVNAAFADGHVEARSKEQMRAVHFVSGVGYWFY
jgi:prepilin-type N-terminal cleavage/methylation domain-containing protein/prepilin-type processing-associated H-X9-DG protein